MKYVLITGGTSGIGYELAKVFAYNHYGVIIVSANKDKLMRAKDKLEKEFNTEIITIQQDLGVAGSAQMVYNQIKLMNIDISILVNNAGVGVVGPFEEVPTNQEENMLLLNVLTLVELCKLFIADMYKRKEGNILNVASTGAFLPGPYTSTYYASKSFVYSFSKAIRWEAKKMGVNVSVLCPGATKTEFFHRTGKSMPKSAMSAEKVAKITYKKLMQNKEVIVPGVLNKFLRYIPIKISMKGIAKLQMNMKKQFKEENMDKLILTSKSFKEGKRIPVQFTGIGEDISPQLMLENIHPNAKSIAIIMDDLNVPIISRYNHWIIWNIPVCNTIPQSIGFGKQITQPFSAVQGLAYGKHRYRGPKPPRFIKSRHTYIFTAYVLDCMCELPPETRKKQWLKAMENNIIQKASLSGTFCNTDT